jgi:hypothetical protein
MTSAGSAESHQVLRAPRWRVAAHRHSRH